MRGHHSKRCPNNGSAKGPLHSQELYNTRFWFHHPCFQLTRPLSIVSARDARRFSHCRKFLDKNRRLRQRQYLFDTSEATNVSHFERCRSVRRPCLQSRLVKTAKKTRILVGHQASPHLSPKRGQYHSGHGPRQSWTIRPGK